MNLLLLRHGEAVEAVAGGDLDRPLTPRGRRRTRAMFRRLREGLPRPDIIVTSAARRARETAELAARALAAKKPVVDASLNPGAAWATLVRAVRKHGRGVETLMLVGHDPEFSAAAGRLLGAAPLALKKGALAWFETDAALTRGALRALVTPALLA